MTLRELAPVVQLLSGPLLLVTAWVAYRNYRYHVRLERLKWLQQLFESFYNSERYKAVRQRIDFADVQGLLTLLRRSDSEPAGLAAEERAQVDQLTDYLNFFEWIAFLETKKQLAFEDLDAMFNYYLKRLLQVDDNRQLRRYIRDKGFERLNRLLNRYSPASDG